MSRVWVGVGFVFFFLGGGGWQGWWGFRFWGLSVLFGTSIFPMSRFRVGLPSGTA